MAIKKLNRILVLLSYCCAFILLYQQITLAQAGVQGTQPQVIKWMTVGGFRTWFSNVGAEGEYFRRDRTTYVAQDQIDGMLYPGEYNSRMKGYKISKALWFGTTNFSDPVTNVQYPYKVVSIGPAGVYMGTEIIADESVGNVGIEMIGKFDHPTVYVDGTVASMIDFNDEVDVLDDNLPCDRIIINKFHTSLGLTVTRKIIAYSQQYNDNYYIYEYTLKNTGITRSGTPVLNNRLTGVVLYLLGRYSFAGESYTGRGQGDWFPAASSWGRNTLIDHVGQDAGHANEIQALIAYWGPHASTAFGSPAADIGLPGPRSTNVWTLAGTQFAGIALVHADQSPGNTTHDRTKLISTVSVGADATRDITNSPAYQYNSAVMTRKYLEFMTAGNPNQTQAEQVGKDANGWPTAYANTFGSDAGGFIGTQGIGPYDLAPGDSVRIVLAECISSISRTKALEVAHNWFKNNTAEFDYPAGYTGPRNDRNDYKNAWVFSGKDSLFQTFNRAITAYSNNYSIQQPPPPPDNFEVNSGGDRIRLSWSNTAETYPNFDGYRVFRAEGRNDTVFTQIFECRKSKGQTVVNSFDDKNALRGFNYYYYVQSIDNGSTNEVEPGVPLVSSKYYTMTNNPAALRRPAGAALTFTTKKSYSGKDSIITVIPATNDTIVDYYFLLPVSLADPSGTVVRGLKVNVNGVRQLPASYSANNDTLRFIRVPDTDSVEVEIISPISQNIDVIFAGDNRIRSFPLPESIVDMNGNRLYNVEVKLYEVTSIGDTAEVVPTPTYELLHFSNAPDSLKFAAAPSDTSYITVGFTAIPRQRNYELSKIRIVPNPFNIKARNIQFGETDLTTLDRLAFYNLPPVCRIKIYTETGDLIETIEHTNGSGDDYWHSLTSSRQVVVSGLYIAYFEVTEDYADEITGEVLYRKGDSIFKKFVIIR